MSVGRYARRRGVVARHAARRAVPSVRVLGALAVIVVSGSAFGAALVGGGRGAEQEAAPIVQQEATPRATGPATAEELPVPQIVQSEAGDPCESEAFLAARGANDAAGMIAAFGGAEGFRLAAAAGSPCIALDDPDHPWVVVNKQRPVTPLDYAPPVVLPADTRNLVEGALRDEAARALDSLIDAASSAGVGEIGLQSGYRSYATQVDTYNAQVAALGQEGADAISARPGHSEHQLGLAADVVACEGAGCGTIYQLDGTPQGNWIAANAWQHGWIIRYEDGHTDTTGYTPEPWHLRYLGTELTQAYHEGGYHTLEEFFGLPAAAGYAP